MLELAAILDARRWTGTELIVITYHKPDPDLEPEPNPDSHLDPNPEPDPDPTTTTATITTAQPAHLPQYQQ